MHCLVWYSLRRNADIIIPTRHWLAKQPSYAASREFDVGSARTTGVLASATQDIEDDVDQDSGPPGAKRTVIQFMPSYGAPFIRFVIAISL